MTRLKQLYGQRLASGQIKPDLAQAGVVERLDALAKALSASRGWFGAARAARGLYMWGSVGRGKSMLMDLFFESLARKDKRRVHFHDFMLEIHAFIFAWRRLSQSESRRHPALRSRGRR
jgi:cell division protein ZapE